MHMASEAEDDAGDDDDADDNDALTMRPRCAAMTVLVIPNISNHPPTQSRAHKRNPTSRCKISQT